MVKIKKQIVSNSIINATSYGYGNPKTYIVIHETANTSKGADAQAHANLQSNGNSRQASWHYQVDDKHSIQSFPDDVQCWHAGGSYNRNSIGIEICVNSDGNFKKAVENAAELTKKLMKDYNIPISNVITHMSASGWKDCPRFLRNGSKGIDWNDFIGMVSGSKGSVTVSTPKPKTESSTTTKSKWTKVTGNWTGQTLGNGEYGKPVEQLQTKLSNNNPPFYPNKGAKNNGIDGYYGNDTEDAVRRFQSYYGLTVDGLAGKQVYNKLKGNSSGKSKPSSKPKANLKIDGKWGKSTTKAIQRALGLKYSDGILSSQPKNSVTRAIYDGVTWGSKGSPTVKALQSKVGASADGKLGPATIRQLQRYLGTPVDGKLSRPSSMVVKEMQRRLNKGTF